MEPKPKDYIFYNKAEQIRKKITDEKKLNQFNQFRNFSSTQIKNQKDLSLQQRLQINLQIQKFAHQLSQFIQKMYKEAAIPDYKSQLKNIQSTIRLLEAKYPDWMESAGSKYIKSLKLNRKTGSIYFQKTNNPQESLLEVGQLVVPLYVNFIENYQKDFSFSLDPNPSQKLSNQKSMPDHMIKWYQIDANTKKNIMGDTKFGDSIFQADFMMKQILIGVDQMGNQFEYRPLVNQIFKSYQLQKFVGQNLQENTTNQELKVQPENVPNLTRFYLKVKPQSVMIQQTKGQEIIQFNLKNPQIQVLARQMQIVNGQMKDKKVQNINSQAYKRAELFTKHYDQISLQYPIFDALKGCMLGIALANLLRDKKIQLNQKDKKAINQLYAQQKIPTYQNKVNTIRGTTKQTFLIMNLDAGYLYQQTFFTAACGGVDCSIGKQNIKYCYNPFKTYVLSAPLVPPPPPPPQFPSLFYVYLNFNHQRTSESCTQFFQKLYENLQQYRQLVFLQRAITELYQIFVQTISPKVLELIKSYKSAKANLLIQKGLTKILYQASIKIAIISIKTIQTLSKLSAKKIPVVSLIFTAYYIIQRINKDSYFKAFFQLASGLLACLPGLGTALSYGIDAGLIVSDAYDKTRQNMGEKWLQYRK